MKVLVIRLSSMGDIVLTSPVLRLLKTELNAQVSFLTKSKYTGLLEHNPHVDRIFALREKVRDSIQELKAQNFNLIIDLHKNIVSYRIILMLGVKSLVYDKRTIDKIRILGLKQTDIETSAVADRYIDTLRTIGISDDGLGLEYFTSPDLVQRDYKGKEEKKSIAIVAGGTYVTKRIPSELILQMIQNQKWNYQLLGGTDVDSSLSDYESSNCFNGIGKLSWHESAAIIRDADLVVTGDTGLMHVAAAYQKPIIVVWGSTAANFGFYPYYGSRSNQRYISIGHELSCRPCSKYGREVCPKGHMNCLNLTKPTQIFQAIEALLG